MPSAQCMQSLYFRTAGEGLDVALIGSQVNKLMSAPGAMGVPEAQALSENFLHHPIQKGRPKAALLPCGPNDVADVGCRWVSLVTSTAGKRSSTPSPPSMTPTMPMTCTTCTGVRA